MSDSAANPTEKLLEELDALMAREPEADRVLRATTELIVSEAPHVRWAGIYFAEQSTLELGPFSGKDNAAPHEVPQLEQPPLREIDQRTREQSVPVLFDGTAVALLVARIDASDEAGEDAAELLRGVASRIAGHCLVAWDTGGVEWEDVS